MASGGKRHGYGTSTTYDDDGAGLNLKTLTALAKVDWPKDETHEVNARDLASPDGYDEVLPGCGWSSTDPLKLEAYFTDDQFADLVTLKQAKTEKHWYLLLPKTSGQTVAPQLTMKGMVKSYKLMAVEAKSDEPIMAEFEVVRTSGKVTFTKGS